MTILALTVVLVITFAFGCFAGATIATHYMGCVGCGQRMGEPLCSACALDMAREGNLVTPEAKILEALKVGDSYGLELSKGTGIPLYRIHSLLWAIEEEGLVESYDGEPLPDRGGRPRRYYRLTG